MKKIFTLLFVTLLSQNVFAEDAKKDSELDKLNKTAKEFASKSAKINTTIDISSFSKPDETKVKKMKEFLDNIESCTSFKGEINSQKYEIKGYEGENCIVTFSGENAPYSKCTFSKENVKKIIEHEKHDSGEKYNIDLDMKMPEINFKDVSSDNLDFGINLALPKIKINKVSKEEISNIMKESCK